MFACPTAPFGPETEGSISGPFIMASEQPLSEQPPSPPMRSVPLLPDASVMKLTRGHSCVLCQQRKVRCDRQKPCANCVKANVECKVVPPQPPRRRKKKPHERDLIERLRKYENLLSQHGVSFEPIAHELKPSDQNEDVNDLEHDLGGLHTSPPDPMSPDGPGKSKWFPYYKEYRNAQVAMQDSSDSEYEGPTIHHAFDSMFDNNDGFPFVVGGATSSVTNLHPSPIQIFQLWQIYISNVNPLLKISHVPTLQALIINASANTARIAKPLEALMFSIYLSAVTSMAEAEVHSTFGEDKSVLLSKYHGATQQALINAGFMRSTELVVLQAYLLYLLSVRQHMDPRALFCLLGIAVRIATRFGLHRDGAQFGIAPFETEQRRRLWWQIVILDKRIAEITGSTITALSSTGADCKIPLNVNDTDLNVHAKDPPIPYSGPTEMMFALTRIELTAAALSDVKTPKASSPSASSTPGKSGSKLKARVQFSPSPSSPDLVTNAANHYLPQDLDAYCAYIENTYLKHCDPKIPLHLFTLLMTRQGLGKLRVIEFLSRGVSVDTLGEADRDALFVEAIQMIDYDNMTQSSEELQPYRWYTHLQVPLPAWMHLVSDLRTRPTGDLCERAWTAMLENHERRGMMRQFRSPIHVALGRFLLKAWDARETAELQRGRSLPAPKLIAFLRQAHQQRGRRPPQGPGSAPSGGTRGPGGPGSSDTAPSSSTTTPTPSAVPSSIGPSDPGIATPTSGYAGRTAPGATPPQIGTGGPEGGGVHGGMMIDDPAAVFQTFDGTHQMYGTQMPEIDLNQMDWNYLMQFGAGGGGGFTGYGVVYPHHPGGGHH